jgi:hypothetical protein
MVPPLAARISRRRLVVKVGTSKKGLYIYIYIYIYIEFQLWLRGSLWRRLVVRVGTSKVSTISQHVCSTSGALATGALQTEEEEHVVNRSASSTFQIFLEQCAF